MEEKYKCFKIIKKYGKETIDFETGEVDRNITYNVEHQEKKTYTAYDTAKDIFFGVAFCSFFGMIMSLMAIVIDPMFKFIGIGLSILLFLSVMMIIITAKQQEKYSYFGIEEGGFENINAAKKYIEHIFYKEFNR